MQRGFTCSQDPQSPDDAPKIRQGNGTVKIRQLKVRALRHSAFRPSQEPISSRHVSQGRRYSLNMILLSLLLFLKPHHLHQKRDDHEHMVKGPQRCRRSQIHRKVPTGMTTAID
jgi:hypothetical protein